MFLLQPDYGMPAGLNYLPFFGVTNMIVLAINNRTGVTDEAGAPGPQAFNDKGDILGTLMSPTNACVWTNGTVISFGSLGGGVSYPFEINQNGDIIGYSNTAPGDTNMVPFMVLAGTTNMQPIAGLDENSLLFGFNSQRQILFTSRTNHYYGFSLWQNGTAQTLGDIIGVTLAPLILGPTNNLGLPTYVDGTYRYLWARSLNDNGEIYGYVTTTVVDNEKINGTTYSTSSFIRPMEAMDFSRASITIFSRQAITPRI
jgi:hypothetical protein